MPELSELCDFSPGQLADQAGALKAKLEAIKQEMIARDVPRAEGNLYRLALSPPGRQNRLDRDALERDHGLEFLAAYCHEVDTGWIMRITARKT
jgi:hypothetical protein